MVGMRKLEYESPRRTEGIHPYQPFERYSGVSPRFDKDDELPASGALLRSITVTLNPSK